MLQREQLAWLLLRRSRSY